MAIIKVKRKKNNFAILDKTIAKDISLSLKAKGLWFQLQCYPENWRVIVTNLVDNYADGLKATYSALKELKQAGYVHYIRPRNDNGVFGKGEYVVYETPELMHQDQPCDDVIDDDFDDCDIPLEPHAGLRHVDERHVDKRHADNGLLLNINNNKYILNKEEEDKPVGHLSSSAAIDLFIGKDLTDSQKKIIKQHSSILSESANISVEQLYQEICFEILDPNSFQKSDGAFHKKLNIICKTIKNGNWTPPARLYLVDKQNQEKKFEALTAKINEATQAIQHWQRMKSNHLALKNFKEAQNCERFMAQYEEELSKVTLDLSHLTNLKQGSSAC